MCAHVSVCGNGTRHYAETLTNSRRLKRTPLQSHSAPAIQWSAQYVCIDGCVSGVSARGARAHLSMKTHIRNIFCHLPPSWALIETVRIQRGVQNGFRMCIISKLHSHKHFLAMVCVCVCVRASWMHPENMHKYTSRGLRICHEHISHQGEKRRPR